MTNKGWLERKITNKEDGRQILEMGSSVNFLVVDKKWKCLLGTQQRAVFKSLGIFGGYVDEGELPEQAMYRELKEETNIDREQVKGVIEVYSNKFVSEGYTDETSNLYIIIVEDLNSLDIKCNDINEDIKIEIRYIMGVDANSINGLKGYLAVTKIQTMFWDNPLDITC